MRRLSLTAQRKDGRHETQGQSNDAARRRLIGREVLLLAQAMLLSFLHAFLNLLVRVLLLPFVVAVHFGSPVVEICAFQGGALLYK